VTASRNATNRLICAAAAIALLPCAAYAGDTSAAVPPAAAAVPAAPAPATSGIALELNKLESSEKGCRPYLVINNATDTAYQSFKLDLVLFQTDGVIGRRFALDLAPVKAQKKTVKLFDLDGIACNKIGSLLINDVTECKADAGPVSTCLQSMTVSALTTVKLSK
jgi:hypothetical protein